MLLLHTVNLALKGYELNVVDYLLKPFGFERFLKAVNKAIGPAPKITVSENTKEKQETVSRIFLKSDKKYVQLILDEIQYLEASGNYTKVVSLTETITTREKFSNVLTALPEHDFLQVHKSFAVAPKHINSIEGNQITIGTTKIPIGKLYKLNVNRLLG